MAVVYAAALLGVCVCALAAASPAPPARLENKGSKIVPDKTIVVRRMPVFKFYPLSLWPMPFKDLEEVREYNRRYQTAQIKQNKR